MWESKADLLDGITSRVFESFPVPVPTPRSCARSRSSKPNLVRNERCGPSTHCSRRYSTPGMDEQRAAHYYCELFAIVFAAVRVQPLDDDWPTSPRSAEGVDSWRRVSVEDFPHLHRVLPALLTFNRSQEFGKSLESFSTNRALTIAADTTAGHRDSAGRTRSPRLGTGADGNSSPVTSPPLGHRSHFEDAAREGALSRQLAV